MIDTEPNAGNVVADTLARPELHEEWIARYRYEAVNRFTADALAVVLRKLALRPGSKVLDAGCGSGTNSLWLAKQGFAVTGADFSDFALGKAAEQVQAEGVSDRVELRLADLTRLPFEDGSFDAVFCLGVLMHIPEVEKALVELARVVREGGALVIAEANAHGLETYAFRLYWKLRRRAVRVERTPAGLEIWSETPAGPLLSRKFFVGWLTKFLRLRGMKRILRLTGELSELYIYSRSGRVRQAIHGLNKLWFEAGAPASLANNNILVFQKGRA